MEKFINFNALAHFSSVLIKCAPHYVVIYLIFNSHRGYLKEILNPVRLPNSKLKVFIVFFADFFSLWAVANTVTLFRNGYFFV